MTAAEAREKAYSKHKIKKALSEIYAAVEAHIESGSPDLFIWIDTKEAWGPIGYVVAALSQDGFHVYVHGHGSHLEIMW